MSITCTWTDRHMHVAVLSHVSTFTFFLLTRQLSLPLSSGGNSIILRKVVMQSEEGKTTLVTKISCSFVA